MTANTTKTLLCLIACVVMASACHNHARHDNHDHEGHDHGTELHDHAAENHDHEAEIHGANQKADRKAPQGTSTGDADHDHEGAGHANAVHFTSQQASLIDFALDTVASSPAVKVIRASARITPTQSQTQTVIAKSNGIVTFSEGPVLSGISVRQGKPIAIISSKGLSGENISVRFAQAKASYEQARDAYERKSRLAETRIVSQAELQAAKAEYETAKAEYENLEGSITGGGQAVTSDINGHISEVLVSNGDYVEQGTPLLRVNGSTRSYVEAQVPARYYPALQHFDSAVITLPGGRSVSLGDVRGRLVSIASSTGAQSSLLPVVLEIDNQSGVVSGSFVDTYLRCTRPGESLSVAKGAIIEQMGSYFVYRMIEPELYQKTQVQTGWSDGRRVEITAGLKAGDIVVSKGAAIVKLAQEAGGLDPHAGHVH